MPKLTNKINEVLPKIFFDLFKKDIILGVIQFGSSVIKKNPNDIDLAVIVKKGKLHKFIENTKNTKPLKIIYDISLILEEELEDIDNFNFGVHGSYLIESFRFGKTLIGKNPFLIFPKTDEKKIKNDIFERMKEYIYPKKKLFESIFFT